MATDTTPDDVRLAGRKLLAVFEGRSAVGSPRHFEDSRRSLNPRAQSDPKLPLSKICDELSDCLSKQLPLLCAEPREVLVEPRKPLVGRQLLRGIGPKRVDSREIQACSRDPR